MFCRLMYEEEKKTIKQIYERKFDSMEKMYRKVIQDYRDQLSICDENEESFSQDSPNESNSFKVRMQFCAEVYIYIFL